MLEPLKQFICDTCGGVIENPEDGWVEWLQYFENGQQINKDFRICHHESRCMVLADRRHVSDGHLHMKLTDNAMVLELYDMLASYNGRTARTVDIPGIVEMLRRLTIPYYDEARQYLNQDNYTGPYDLMSKNLQGVIEE